MNDTFAIPWTNLVLAWGLILTGFASGAILGLFYHRDDWLGGYSSWQRRMLRLGHIAFIGMGIINFMYALTVRGAVLPPNVVTDSLFALGGVGMPVICLLAAWRKPFRQLFFIPVVSLLLGTLLLLRAMILR